MDTPLGGHHGMQFVDDHVFDFANDGLEPWRSDGNGEAFRRRDEDVRRISQHLLTVRLGRVPGSQANANLLGSVGQIVGFDFFKRADQVALNVVGEGLNGRNVDRIHLFFQFFIQRKSDQSVDNAQERRKRFSRTRGRTQ